MNGREYAQAHDRQQVIEEFCNSVLSIMLRPVAA